MENKRMSELPVAIMVGDEDYTIIVQDGINKRASREIFKQKEYNNLNHIPYINSNYSSSLIPTNEILQGTIQFHKISKTGRYSDLIDLPFIPTALTQLTNDGYFVQDQYYVHTDNNLTSGLINKIDSAIQAINVNNTLLTPNENQEVNIVMPINLTDLTNDGYFVQDANYVHTDNNFTTISKNNYDNLVSNVNQPVSSTNKLATMNDLAAIDSGYWVVIDIYKDITFDGVINVGEEIPTIGIYAVIEGTDNLTISKYTNGVSDDLNLPIKEGYFVFVSGNDVELIYYIKENTWKKLSTDLSNYYNKQEGDNRYVQKEEGKDLITNEEREKLAEITTNANHVQKSNTNGNIRIDGEETVVYSLTKGEVIKALGYTPVEATADLSDYYDKQQSDNRYVQKENDKELITSAEKTKLAGISTNANKVEKSNTNGNIKIDGVETKVYSITKNEVITALGYTPIENLSDYYNKTQSDNRYVQKEEGKELILSEERTKLSGISSGANKIENSITNGNIKIDGEETTVYSLTKTEIVTVLGFTPIEITSAEKTKLAGISTNANKVEKSNTNGNIKIDGTETVVYSLTKAGVTSALGYTPATTDVATSSKNGLLSSTDKQKIDAIESIYLKKTENAVSATKLQTARKINGVSFDGTADINIDIAKEFFYSAIPMSPALADMYAEVELANEFPGCHLENLQYSGDKFNNTFRYVYNIRNSATYMVGHFIINPLEKSNVEYEYGFPSDTRDTESRLSVSDWGDTIYISVKGNPQNCKKIEYSVSEYYSQYNWQTGEDGNLSTYYYFPYSSSGYYYINIRITFNDNTSVMYSDERWCEGPSGGLACFTGETLVATENELKFIKDLKVNDKVYSKNTKGQFGLAKIIRTYSHITDRIYKIDIGENIINASWSHPFYVKGKGKVLTKDLKVGDELENKNNKNIIIKYIEMLSQPTEVFEIKVEDNLNYFVGKDSIFVGCEDLDKIL